MSQPRFATVALMLPLAAAMACMSSSTYPPESSPTPATGTTTAASPARPLPPIPEVDGPLAIRVVYPAANSVVTSKDSNFIFGSIGSGKATLTVNGVPSRVWPNGAFMVYLANPPADAPKYELVAVRGSDTARATHVIRYPAVAVAQVDSAAAPKKPEGQATSRADTIAALNARIDSLRLRLTRDEPVGWVQLGQPSAAADTDRTIIGRPIRGGTYKWFFTPGTVVPLLERSNGSARIRLDGDLDVWVDSADAIDLPADTPAPRRVVSNMRVRGAPMGVDVIMPIGPRA